MSKYCPECGTERSKGAKFCVTCGKSFSDKVSTSKTLKKKEPKLHHLKEKVNKWKGEGYKVDELERMISSIVKIKLNRKEIKQVAIISISIAIALVCITIIISSISVTEIPTFNIEFGLPFPWLHLFRNYQYWPPTIEISNWLNLIVNFIFYVVLVFGISYYAETILKRKKIRKES